MATEQLSIRLDTTILQEIKEMAEKESRTRNNMIEVLVKEALQARKKQNPPE